MEKKSKKKFSKKTKDNGQIDCVERPLQLSGSVNDSLLGLEDVTPIIEFLEMFRELSDPRAQLPLKLISIKVPVPLLEAFRFKCQRSQIPYQTKIKMLMREWLKSSSS